MTVAPHQLGAFVARARVSAADLAARPADLVLACACALGDAPALDAFHASCVAPLGRLLGPLRLTPALRAELEPCLWMRLFGGAHPKIGSYSGKGPLAAWVRVVATRLAIDLRTQRGPLADAEGDAVLAGAVADGLPPEVAVARRRYGGALEEALASAIGRLNDDDRRLLRWHFVDGLSIDGLAVRLSIHRATAARRIVKLQKLLLADVSSRLCLDLKTSTSEIRSLVDALGQELQVSISRLLPAPPP